MIPNKKGGIKMKVRIARKEDSAATLMSFQRPFPHVTKCYKCRGDAPLAFVAQEVYKGRGKRIKYVSDIFETTGEKGGLWLHDLCAVAVYFCRKCLNPTALYNQG
jgi:hypothetical protein